MNKKIIIIVAVILLAAAGYFFFMRGGEEEETEQGTKTEESAKHENVWNPYSEETAHVVTLSDMILSASEGRYIVKMTNTIKFTDEESFYKFKGFESKKLAEEALAEEGGHGGDEEHVTPMEIKINDIISDLMLQANENQILDKKMLKAYLIQGINENLKVESPVVADMYIENYVIQ